MRRDGVSSRLGGGLAEMDVRTYLLHEVLARTPLRTCTGSVRPDGGADSRRIVSRLFSFAVHFLSGAAADPWLDSWLAVVEIIPVRGPAPAVRGADGGSLPLHPGAGDCWPLFALSGGRPVTLAGEWTPRGLWPLTAWDEAGRAVPL